MRQAVLSVCSHEVGIKPHNEPKRSTSLEEEKGDLTLSRAAKSQRKKAVRSVLLSEKGGGSITLLSGMAFAAHSGTGERGGTRTRGAK